MARTNNSRTPASAPRARNKASVSFALSPPVVSSSASMASASSATATEASRSFVKAPFSRIAPSRSSAGARLKYRARRSENSFTSSRAA